MKNMATKVVATTLAILMVLSIVNISFVFADGITKLSKKSKTTIMAENYTRASTTISKENGSLSFQKNYWVEFDVESSGDEEYEVIVVSGAPHERNLAVNINGTRLATVKSGATSAYADYIEESVGIAKLLSGPNVIRVTNSGSACYLNAIILIPLSLKGESTAVKTGPYRVHDLPTIIEAENYDFGPDGSYSVDGKNAGKPYRTETIDVYEKSDRSSYYISLVESEFVKYTFNVKKSGAYTMYVKGDAAFANIYIDNMNTPLKEGILLDSNYKEKELLSVYLEEGEHTLKVKSASGIAEIDYFRFATCFGDYIMMEDVVKPQRTVYKEFYMSPNGDDKNAGTKEAPFKTLKKAKEEVAKISDKMTGDIIVNIASGYYQLTETEVFNETHSGKNGFNIIYRGEDKNNPPLFSGGKKVEGWEKVSDYLWKAPVETETAVRNLYVNGLPAVRARSKYSYIHRGDYDIIGDPHTPNGFKASVVNFPTQIVGEKDLETVWTSEWTAQRALVLDTHIEGDMVCFNMEPTFWVNRNTSTYLNTGNIFYIENSFALLDEPGEFYYNKEEKCIYYYPYKEENLKTADTYISELEGLLYIDGKDLENRVENITFENLEFRYGVWDNVSKYGLRARQSDMLGLVGGNQTDVIPGQIRLNRTRNVDFINSRFACLGSVGIALEDAVEATDIRGNIFRDISATALLVGLQEHKIVAEGSEMVKDIYIENNVFRRNACEYLGSHNIMLLYERNINIIHNALMDVPYSNISAGWGWGGTGNSKVCGEYIIKHNQIFNSMMLLKDGGPIYTLGDNQNSLIQYNHFDGIGDGGRGYGAVYNDQGSQHFTYINNVVSDHSAMWFVNINSSNLLAKDNYIKEGIDEANARATDGSLTNVKLEGTVAVKDGQWPDEAVKIMEEAGLEDEYDYLLPLSEVPAWRKENFRTVPKWIYPETGGWIEAENYMPGGNKVGHYNPADGIIYLAKKVTNDGYFIHKNGSGLWMKYEFEVEESGNYDIYTKVAQGWGDSDAKPGLQFSIDDKIVIEEYMVPKTSWNLFNPRSAGTVFIEKGKHVLKVELLHNGMYLDAFKIVPEGTDLSILSDPNFDDGKLVYQYPEDAKEEKGFKDIKGHWAEKEINEMTEKGYLKGYDENTFAPDDNVTLYQAIWLAMRVMGYNYSEETWQADAMEYGIIDESLEADKDVSREEFILIIMKAYSGKFDDAKESDGKFADDSDISTEYKKAVMEAKGLGFVNGDEKGNFNPQKVLSRAEAVTVLSNILN